MNDLKPGYKCTEMYLTLGAVIVSALLAFGVIHGDAATIQDAVAKAITAAVSLVSTCVVLWKYLHDRADLKGQHLAQKVSFPELPAVKQESGSWPNVMPMLGVCALLGLLGVGTAGVAQAAEPVVKYTALAPAKPRTVLTCFAWRQQISSQIAQLQAQIAGLKQQPQTDPAVVAALAQIAANQTAMMELLRSFKNTPPAAPAPAPVPIAREYSPSPQIHYHLYGAPLQQLPIEGQPKQKLPIEGDPKQKLPIEGQPKQQMPIDGQPKQQVPIEGDPKQKLPVLPPVGGPDQKLPLEKIPAPNADPSTGFQRYQSTGARPWVKTLAKPIK